VSLRPQTGGGVLMPAAADDRPPINEWEWRRPDGTVLIRELVHEQVPVDFRINTFPAGEQPLGAIEVWVHAYPDGEWQLVGARYADGVWREWRRSFRMSDIPRGEDRVTPEQEARRAAEADPAPVYADGRPKYHRHFAEWDVHTDRGCEKPSTPRRVYVFDEDALDAHEAHIRANERAKAYDDVIATLRGRA